MSIHPLNGNNGIVDPGIPGIARYHGYQKTKNAQPIPPFRY